MIVRIPQKLIDELISLSNIVDIIQKRIPLKKQGENFVASCPFHIDKNPSFTVNFKKQFYYCFSCRSHGNVINFLMNYDHLTFIESIKELSIIHSVSIENFLNPINKKHAYKDNLYNFMNDLCNFYQKNLTQKKYICAYQYLQNRGLTNDSILQFNIGFAPTGWHNINQTFNSRLYNQKLISQSGMIIQSQNKKYDRFRNRIMFPIKDTLGRVIAFGGRLIQCTKNSPKYLNPPDTELFKKNQCLYGFYEVRKKYKNIPYILVVEGYMDVITLTQFGIKYTVASLGTFITINQIQLIYNVTNQLICCYDGDNAGKNAAWHTLNTVLSYLTDGREIFFIFLDDKEDPDTSIRKIGKKKFLEKIAQAQNLSYFLFNTLSKKVNLQTLEGRVKLSKLALPMLNKIPGPTLRLCLRQELGNKIGILDDNKLNQLLTIKLKPTFSNIKKKNIIPYNIEHILTGLLIQNPKLSKLVPILSELKVLKNNKIIVFMQLVKICKSYPNLNTDQLLQYYCRSIKNQLFLYLKTLSHWNHMIANDMIEITFIDALTQLYNLILEQRQNALIALDRMSGLTKKERQELWLLNQTLSTSYNNIITF